ncbi:MAG: ISNCY family transposase [Bdellovibrionia bacterium]
MVLFEWERSVKRTDIIIKALNGVLTWVQVAETLQLSSRQVRRIRKRFENAGPAGLLDKRILRHSWNKVPERTIQKVLQLYREEYFDYNVKHFHEKLQSEHNVKQSYPWTLYTLQHAGLVSKNQKRDPHRKKRERRPLEGMMLHLDGSTHNWIGNAGPKWDLLATVDDATNEVYDAFFTAQEDTRSVLKIVHQTVEKKGVFCSLYTDRGTHFVYTPKAGEKHDSTIRTQCQRALDQLGIQLILAYSPQARGRGERLWRTFQGRIPQEFRRQNITTMEAANKYLSEVFIPEYNLRFKKSPKEEGSVFLSPPAGVDLNLVFSIRHDRMVNPDNTISYKRKTFQLPPSSLRYSFARCKVQVHEHLDGRYTVTYGAHKICTFNAEAEVVTETHVKRKAA